ncbi:hypothetical protein KSP40_PGU004192 [Platanthera guangdongensis]|uniref:Phosphatidic acid phosphatase type 2/haloperoxidase domain-containing protein n=1 Tax=Platanthera guangdongensis TaxID=2320717 RepID=A0ABR2N1T7_9ASPA
MGTVLNFWLSIALKQMINQERPSELRSDPGMPSSHAQFLFFAVVSALLSLMKWMKITVLTVAIGTFTLICGSYLSWLRVSQGLHTKNQVLAGAAIGSICGMTWFWVWHEFVLEAVISSNWVQKTVAVASAVFCIICSLQSLSHLRRGEY